MSGGRDRPLGTGYWVAEAQGDNPGRQIAQVATESCDILKIIVSVLAHTNALKANGKQQKKEQEGGEKRKQGRGRKTER